MLRMRGVLCLRASRHRAFNLAPTSFISSRITNNANASSTLFNCFGSYLYFKSRFRICDIGGEMRSSSSSSTVSDWSLCSELTHAICTI